MAKITRFKNGNENIRIVTQQYEVGTYVAIYDDDTNAFLDQFGTELNEEDFHKTLREEYKDNLIN